MTLPIEEINSLESVIDEKIDDVINNINAITDSEVIKESEAAIAEESEKIRDAIDVEYQKLDELREAKADLVELKEEINKPMTFEQGEKIIALLSAMAVSNDKTLEKPINQILDSPVTSTIDIINETVGKVTKKIRMI